MSKCIVIDVVLKHNICSQLTWCPIYSQKKTWNKILSGYKMEKTYSATNTSGYTVMSWMHPVNCASDICPFPTLYTPPELNDPEGIGLNTVHVFIKNITTVLILNLYTSVNLYYDHEFDQRSVWQAANIFGLFSWLMKKKASKKSHQASTQWL